VPGTCLQGLGATLLRNTPANAIYLGNFEMLKAAYMRKNNCTAAEIPGYVVLGSAGVAGQSCPLACVHVVS